MTSSFRVIRSNKASVEPESYQLVDVFAAAISDKKQTSIIVVTYSFINFYAQLLSKMNIKFQHIRQSGHITEETINNNKVLLFTNKSFPLKKTTFHSFNTIYSIIFSDDGTKQNKKLSASEKKINQIINVNNKIKLYHIQVYPHIPLSDLFSTYNILLNTQLHIKKLNENKNDYLFQTQTSVSSMFKIKKINLSIELRETRILFNLRNDNNDIYDLINMATMYHINGSMNIYREITSQIIEFFKTNDEVNTEMKQKLYNVFEKTMQLIQKERFAEESIQFLIQIIKQLKCKIPLNITRFATDILQQINKLLETNYCEYNIANRLKLMLEIYRYCSNQLEYENIENITQLVETIMRNCNTLDIWIVCAELMATVSSKGYPDIEMTGVESVENIYNLFYIHKNMSPSVLKPIIKAFLMSVLNLSDDTQCEMYVPNMNKQKELYKKIKSNKQKLLYLFDGHFASLKLIRSPLLITSLCCRYYSPIFCIPTVFDENDAKNATKLNHMFNKTYQCTQLLQSPQHHIVSLSLNILAHAILSAEFNQDNDFEIGYSITYDKSKNEIIKKLIDFGLLNNLEKLEKNTIYKDMAYFLSTYLDNASAESIEVMICKSEILQSFLNWIIIDKIDDAKASTRPLKQILHNMTHFDTITELNEDCMKTLKAMMKLVNKMNE